MADRDTSSGDISNREIRGLNIRTMIAIIGATAAVVGGGWKIYDNNEKDKAASNVRITNLETQVANQQGQINSLVNDKTNANINAIQLRDEVEELQRRIKRK